MEINNVTILPSERYQQWYSVKKLSDRFKNANFFVVPTPKKGVGKTYSVMNEILIPDIKLGKKFVYIRWTKSEIEAFITELQDKPHVFVDKIGFAIKFKSRKNFKIMYNAETKEPIAYLITPNAIETIKGMAQEQDLELKHLYWDEFLRVNGIYVKAQDVLEGFWDLIGSLFRTNDYYIWMTANNNNPNNPFYDHLFSEIGWPEYGTTHYDAASGVVIDSPFINDYILDMYKNSKLYKNSRIHPAVHQRLFGETNLTDNTYMNLHHIVPHINYELKNEFNFQLGTIKYMVFTYEELGYTRIYILNGNLKPKFKVNWACDDRTFKETGLPLIPSKIVKYLQSQLEYKNLRFRDGNTQKNIIDWLKKQKFKATVLKWGN